MEFTRTKSKIDLRAQARMITTICLLGGVDVQIVDPIQSGFSCTRNAIYYLSSALYLTNLCQIFLQCFSKEKVLSSQRNQITHYFCHFTHFSAMRTRREGSTMDTDSD